MTARILQGDVFDVLPTLAKGSVDCCVTSPPYWMLRSYLPKHHPLKPLELGSEPTPAAYVENMVRVFRLVREAMAEHATCWLNIGDTYFGDSPVRATASEAFSKEWDASQTRSRGGSRRSAQRDGNLTAGNLCLIPWRLAIALQDDGWVVRSVVCWCLSPSTVVYAKTATTEGPMTIHDLVRLDPATVKLWTGKKWSQVRGWSETQTAGNTFRFTLRSGETITCTGNHQWPLWDGRVARADQINEGDVLATCLLPQPDEPDGLALDDLAWFAGLYLAEGHLNDDCVTISGHSKEIARHNKVVDIAKKYGGSATLTCNGDTAIQRVHGRILLGAIEHFIAGKGAKGKHFHSRVWQCSNGLLHSLLRGYLDGDGHWDEKNRRWRLGFCRNNALAQDLRTVAARLDMVLTLNPTYSRMGRTRVFEAYRGEIRFKQSDHHNSKQRSEVVKIDRGWGGTFYDIGIADEPHLFALASGVLTHNSKPAPMPSSVSGWAWRRCRVKVKEGNGYSASKGAPRANGTVQRNPDSSRNPDLQAQWSDCPGCPKCTPHGGYVLRRGSWRPTSSWEPVLMLAKSAGYFADGEAVKQPAARDWKDSGGSLWNQTGWHEDARGEDASRECERGVHVDTGMANLRDVWTIAAEPLKERHYAAYPSELVYRCLRAGTSARGYCPSCGKPWCRVVETTPMVFRHSGRGQDQRDNGYRMALHGTCEKPSETRTLDWRPTCTCPPHEPRPGLVLDPFAGSGRTGIVAGYLKLNFVGIDLNPEYIKMANRLIKRKMPWFSRAPDGATSTAQESGE